MQDFIQGQRWISDAEPELGLGIVSAVEHRAVTLDFPGSGETRLYSRANAPLTRIRFKPGDEIRGREGGRFEVLDVEITAGLLSYRARTAEGGTAVLPETALADTIDLDRPLQRLLAGQVDASAWFRLRHRSLQVLNFIERSPLLGLCSARTDLIPHQLYIAAEVAARHAPRVLLADEVGLGKTIEAGLILQQQLISGMAARVLIVVPEALVHQWLVEMLRRFNLAFSIFDEERCAALDEEGHANPFFAEQLVLCSAGFMLGQPARHAQALAAGWDLLIVDEAHHLQAPPSAAAERRESGAAGAGEEAASVRAYRQIRAFSDKVQGLILLTATPDQAGAESHFALLHLLDPDRFHALDAFRREQQRFSQVADLVERLEQLEAGKAAEALDSLAPALAALLGDAQIDALLERLRDSAIGQADWQATRAQLMQAVLDRHGTGRVLFRNTRKTVSGFPERLLHPHPLPCPASYAGLRGSLQPEQSSPDWLECDPRVALLLDLLAAHREEKILLICAEKTSAIALEEFLRLRKGLRSSVFHEDMSIVERDRAAAFFADPEQGARILLCSEIGSEGRNFQFSHRLVLFDLPRNPDLLEQRIGRLDRIGQRHPVDIHVPYLQATAQEVLFRWYQEGLNAFVQTNPVAYKLYEEQAEALERLFANPEQAAVDAFIDYSAGLNRSYRQEAAGGRDRLLEMSSYRPDRGEALLKALRQLEASASPRDYLLEVLDSFGIEAEEHGPGSWALQPGEHMLVSHFAGLPDEGLTLTFDRQLALHRDDIQFATWFHPLVSGSIDAILQGFYGKTAVGIVQDPRFAPGSLLLESLYQVSATAPRELQLQRFLPCTVLRVLVDSEGNELSEAISLAALGELLRPVDRNQLIPHIAEHRDSLVSLAARSRALAESRLPPIVQQSSAAMLAALTGEIKRLAALQQVNPNVREAELAYLKHQVRGLHTALAGASVQLEGLQLVFAV